MENKDAKFGGSKLTVEPTKIDMAPTTEGYYKGGLRKPIDGTMMLPTWTGVLPILIISFFLLKKMIYIKDEKRHGK